MPDPLPTQLIEIEVKPEHIDSLGHVNNAVYVKYFERGRIDFYKQLELPLESRHPPRLGTVVVNLNVDFRDECVAGDQLLLTTRGHKRGNRSFTLDQQLTRPGGESVAQCNVTSVMMDLDSRTVIDIPKSLADALPPR
jgi:thioesterase-3